MKSFLLTVFLLGLSAPASAQDVINYIEIVACRVQSAHGEFAKLKQIYFPRKLGAVRMLGLSSNVIASRWVAPADLPPNSVLARFEVWKVIAANNIYTFEMSELRNQTPYYLYVRPQQRAGTLVRANGEIVARLECQMVTRSVARYGYFQITRGD